jgi:hypothetical protein
LNHFSGYSCPANNLDNFCRGNLLLYITAH